MSSAFNQDNPGILNADILTTDDQTTLYPNSIDITNLPDGTVTNNDTFLGLDASNSNQLSVLGAIALTGGSGNYQLLDTAITSSPVSSIDFTFDQDEQAKYILIAESVVLTASESIALDFSSPNFAFGNYTYSVQTSAYNINLATRFDYKSTGNPGYVAGDVILNQANNMYIEIGPGSTTNTFYYDSTSYSLDSGNADVIYRSFGFADAANETMNGMRIYSDAANIEGVFQLFKLTT